MAYCHNKQSGRPFPVWIWKHGAATRRPVGTAPPKPEPETSLRRQGAGPATSCTSAGLVFVLLPLPPALAVAKLLRSVLLGVEL